MEPSTASVIKLKQRNKRRKHKKRKVVRLVNSIKKGIDGVEFFTVTLAILAGDLLSEFVKLGLKHLGLM